MKTVIIILSGLFLPIMAFCQLSGVGLNVGGAASTFEYGNQVNNVSEFDNGTHAGGTGGVRLDFDLNNDYVKVSPEFFIVQNGSKEYYQTFNAVSNDLVTNKVSLNYVGLYLPITFYLPLGDDDYSYNGILLQGRLFGDYAISGEIDNSKTGRSEVRFEKPMDKFDYGYSIEGGFVSNGIKISIGYNWGIKNIEFSNALGNVSADNYLINNRGLTLQVGYWQRLDN